MTLAVWAQVSPKAVRTADEMDPLLAKIATYGFDQSRIPLAQFTMFVQDSLTNPALLKQIEARLDQFLQSDATAAGKDFAFRELSLIATDASLPVLTPLLTDPAKAEMARYALSKIPGPAADEALRSSLAKATGNTKDRHYQFAGAAAQCIVGSRAGAAGVVVRCRGGRSGSGGAGADCRPSVAGCAGSRARQGHGPGEATHRRGVRASAPGSSRRAATRPRRYASTAS